jgi:hypothetical protein
MKMYCGSGIAGQSDVKDNKSKYESCFGGTETQPPSRFQWDNNRGKQRREGSSVNAKEKCQ